MRKILLSVIILLTTVVSSFGQCSKIGGTINWPNSTSFTPTASPLQQDIIIPAGVSCTLNNLTRELAPGVTITVKAGATLILNNVHFTSCDTSLTKLWGGIIIEGTRNQPQVTIDTSAFTSYQGVVIIKNGSSIEYASTGVQVGISSSSSQNGGVLRCINSKFYNCKKGVIFYPYAGYANFSYFAKDSFIWDKFVQSDKLFDSVYHVKLDNVKGVYFHNGNVFINKVTYQQMVDGGVTEFRQVTIDMKATRGTGILSDEATFYLKRGGPCYSLINSDVASTCIYCHGDKNVFEGLGLGIGILGADNRSAIITGCKFTNNWNGIRASEINKLYINRNDFIMDDSIKRYFDFPRCTAVVVDNATQAGSGTSAHQIEISENHVDFLVTRYTSRSIDGLTCGNDRIIGFLFNHGSAINNGTDDLIYHNYINMKFRSLTCLTQVYGITLSGDNRKLRIECNNFELDPELTKEDTLNNNHTKEDDYYDIGTLVDGDRMKTQGSTVREAANVFSPTCGQVYDNQSNALGKQWHISYLAQVSAPTINYYYNSPTSTKEPICIEDPNSNFSKLSTGAYYSCPFSAFCHFFDTSENIAGHTVITGVGTGSGDDDPGGPKSLTDKTDDDWEKGLMFLTGDTLVRYFEPGRQSQIEGAGGGTLRLYNPDQEVRTYYSKIDEGPATLIIYDITGRKVGSYILTSNNGQIELPRKSATIYIYQVYSQGILLQSGKLFVK